MGWLLLLFLVFIFIPSEEDQYDDYDDLGMVIPPKNNRSQK